jgi:hypothetical protein
MARLSCFPGLVLSFYRASIARAIGTTSAGVAKSARAAASAWSRSSLALEDEGYAVEDVASGEEAVARFTEDPFELVREMVALECGLVAIKAR